MATSFGNCMPQTSRFRSEGVEPRTVIMGVVFSKLPREWPSPYYNKCSNRKCKHPNSPQVASGTYTCLGIVNGRPCRGTYEVTLARARKAKGMYDHLWAEMRREELLRRMRQRKDLACLRQYQDERNYCWKVVNAAATGDIVIVKEYISNHGLADLLSDKRQFMAHVEDLKLEIEELNRRIGEILRALQHYPDLDE